MASREKPHPIRGHQLSQDPNKERGMEKNISDVLPRTKPKTSFHFFIDLHLPCLQDHFSFANTFYTIQKNNLKSFNKTMSMEAI